MAIVYIHRRNDIKNTFKNVFYVGIGKDKQRAYHKRKTERNKFWRNIVNKIDYSVEITHENIIYEEARAIEKYLICFYGRRNLNLGNLCNLTDGGEGVINYIDTPERLKKRIEIAKEVNNREGAREKMSISLKKSTSNPERRKQMSISAFEMHRNKPELNSQVSLKLKIMHSNPEFKEKHRIATTKALSSLDVRKKMSDSLLKKIKNNPEIKEKSLLQLKRIIDNKELLNKRNDSIKKAWANRPEIIIAILKCENPKCNKEFEQKRSFQKYCCYKCGGKYARLKKKLYEKV